MIFFFKIKIKLKQKSNKKNAPSLFENLEYKKKIPKLTNGYRIRRDREKRHRKFLEKKKTEKNSI